MTVERLPVLLLEGIIVSATDVALLLPFAYLIDIALMLVTDDNQRVGDLVADTVVVKQT